MQTLFDPNKVKSLVWIERDGSFFVVRLTDSVKQDVCYRPVVGSVEFIDHPCADTESADDIIPL